MNKTTQYLYLEDDKQIVPLAEHKFGWKLSEIVGLLLFTALGVTLTVAVQPIVMGIVVLMILPYFIYVNFKRKNVSHLVFASTPEGLRLYKNKISIGNNNAVSPTNITEITMTTDLNKNSFIILRPNPDMVDEGERSGLKIPERIYRTDSFRGFVESLVQSEVTKVAVTDKAKTILSA